MEICSHNLFSMNCRTMHSQWMSQAMGAAAEKSGHPAYQPLHELRIPVVDHASSSPPAARSFPSVEDEEARHGPLNDFTGGASPANSEIRATFSIFREPVPTDEASLSVRSPRKMPVDTSSDNIAPQADLSFQNTIDHKREPPSSLYGGHFSHQFFGLPVQPRPLSNTMAGDVSDISPECEKPTEPPMPKGNNDVLRDTDSDSELDDSDDGNGEGGGTPVQPSNQGRPSSPIRRPTYTHLSDVSNDSVDDAGGKKQPAASYANPKTWKPIGTAHGQPLPNFSYFFANHPRHTNDTPGTVSTAVFEEYVFKVLTQTLPKTKLSKLLSRLQARLNDNTPNIKSGKAFVRELHSFNGAQPSVSQKFGNISEDRGQSVTREVTRDEQHLRSLNDEHEIVDHSHDDEENAAGSQEEKQQAPEQSSPPEEQQFQQNAIIQLHVDQMQPGKPRAMYSLSEKPPTMGAEACTPVVHNSPKPAKELVLPTHFNEVGMQSAALSEEAVVQLPPQSPMELCSPQPFSHVQHCNTEDSAENGPGPVVPSAELVSGLPAQLSSSSHDHPMEPIFVTQPSALFPEAVPQHSPPLESESMPGTSRSVVAFFSRQAPAQQDVGEEHVRAFERKSREPWDHKGLLRFIALNAFTLPHHVWIEREEGQPRRSMRIAMKKQVKTCVLRERLS
ncbi:uncharacterized protein LOC126162315 [Schistocerca cancellata]|uniref:uncharacterized protein LOC126162315 n=1 Tax=Schistocerca cancellata TaxID=274614 RepID=UPI002118A66C|nr:uncharacterized protein LOC126162315 [Schistocerca cancellata]